jgi:hypothetical protein
VRWEGIGNVLSGGEVFGVDFFLGESKLRLDQNVREILRGRLSGSGMVGVSRNEGYFWVMRYREFF